MSKKDVFITILTTILAVVLVICLLLSFVSCKSARVTEIDASQVIDEEKEFPVIEINDIEYPIYVDGVYAVYKQSTWPGDIYYKDLYNDLATLSIDESSGKIGDSIDFTYEKHKTNTYNFEVLGIVCARLNGYLMDPYVDTICEIDDTELSNSGHFIVSQSMIDERKGNSIHLRLLISYPTEKEVETPVQEKVYVTKINDSPRAICRLYSHTYEISSFVYVEFDIPENVAVGDTIRVLACKSNAYEVSWLVCRVTYDRDDGYSGRYIKSLHNATSPDDWQSFVLTADMLNDDGSLSLSVSYYTR